VRGAADLPDDVDVLKQTIMHLLASMNKLAASNAKLSEQLAYMLRRYHGRQSEKMDAAQLALFAEMLGEAVEAAGEESANAGEDAGKTTSSKKPRKKPTGRRPLPEHLPRVIEEYTLDPSMLACETCGQLRVVIGRKTSDQLELVPAKLIVICRVAYTYACRNGCEGAIETAPKPGGAICKCLAGPGLLAHVIVSKFDDHLPVYRQEEIFKRNGIDISQSTMCGWLMGCAAALEPVYKFMHRRILRSRVIQTDGSTLPMMEPGRGSTRAAGFWVYRGDDRAPYVAYDFTEKQDRAGPMRWLKGFSGVSARRTTSWRGAACREDGELCEGAPEGKAAAAATDEPRSRADLA
jgi:transposase